LADYYACIGQFIVTDASLVTTRSSMSYTPYNRAHTQEKCLIHGRDQPIVFDAVHVTLEYE